MKRLILIGWALLLAGGLASAQEVIMESGRFQKGDNPAWQAPDFADAAWPVLVLDKDWNQQGIQNTNGIGWYRIHVVVPSSLKKGVVEAIMLDLGAIDDSDETWFNGHLVGKTGRFPSDKGGYSGEWQQPRRYIVDPKWVRWDGENVIAVRVFNGGDPGGFYQRSARIVKPGLTDCVSLKLEKEKDGYTVVLSTAVKTAGTLKIEVADALTGQVESSKTQKVSLGSWKEKRLFVPLDHHKRLTVVYTDPRFEEEEVAQQITTPYILTPKAPATPRYNGPLVFGVRPGSPVIFRLAFSGEKPMKYAVEGLPEGVVRHLHPGRRLSAGVYGYQFQGLGQGCLYPQGGGSDCPYASYGLELLELLGPERIAGKGNGFGRRLHQCRPGRLRLFLYQHRRCLGGRRTQSRRHHLAQ